MKMGILRGIEADWPMITRIFKTKNSNDHLRKVQTGNKYRIWKDGLLTVKGALRSQCFCFVLSCVFSFLLWEYLLLKFAYHFPAGTDVKVP